MKFRKLVIMIHHPVLKSCPVNKCSRVSFLEVTCAQLDMIFGHTFYERRATASFCGTQRFLSSLAKTSPKRVQTIGL